MSKKFLCCSIVPICFRMIFDVDANLVRAQYIYIRAFLSGPSQNVNLKDSFDLDALTFFPLTIGYNNLISYKRFSEKTKLSLYGQNKRSVSPICL